ncbi:MAG: dihydroorotate dehydrogenase B catalytic subunit [spirochete symbiont of Stewartia floridana]|nr:MAG: dihydroorotate dehydrogenase B catalytic subunit [spirochete symbiont of Stewartia floridana]
MELIVTIGGKVLPNPVGAASGVIGFGDEYASLTDLNSLGALYTKAVTPEPRAGNTPPRLVETPAGLINSIGLANPGLEGFLRDKLPILRGLPCPAIVNVAGSLEDDYVRVSEALAECEEVWGVELNVSCPNVDHGGKTFGTEPGILASLVRAVRRVMTKPLIVKLSPAVTDIAQLAKAAEDAGADAVSCINTLVGMKVDIHLRRPVIPRGTGGLSGPAIRPVGVAAVWQAARAVKIPVIGVGGIAGASDALEYLLAGASAIQIGTALFAEPEIPARVLSGIRQYLRKGGLRKISDLHGFF